MARQRIDQTIETRNIRAQNGRIEQVHWSRVKKGEMSAEKENLKNAFKGKRTHSVEEETPVVLNTGLIPVKGCNRPLPLQERRHRLTEESVINVAV